MIKTYALVIGANGLIGRQVGRLLGEESKSWQGTVRSRPEERLRQLDLTDSVATERLLYELMPEGVYLCANLAGGVDFCERTPEAGRAFYVEGTRTIALACKRLGCWLGFISTDYVFDGQAGPYREEDATHPLNKYGEFKLEAEDIIRQTLQRYSIVRTTNVYGWDPLTVTPNFMMQLYRSISQDKPFRAASYLWGNPTYAADLAAALIELQEKRGYGTFHVVGPTFINRYDWALKACAAWGFNTSLIEEAREIPPGMVARPLKAPLSCERFQTNYRTRLMPLEEGLLRMKDTMGGR